MNSLLKAVTGQHRGCDLNPGPSAPESIALTTRLPSHHAMSYDCYICAGDEDAGRDNGRVHSLLAAVLHPRPSQTVLPPVRRRRRHTRLAHQVRWLRLARA